MTSAAQALDHLKTLNLLYVEDDPEVRAEMAAYLGRRVGALHLAGNGAEGLAAFTAVRPDLVVTDIRMPVLDGLAMAQAIRAADPLVPIVVTTAFEQTDYLQRAIEIGVTRYVLKPVHADQLEAALLDCARRLYAESQLARRRQLDEELARLRQQATLMGGIGHDFNNLLTAVLCNLDVARIQVGPDSKARVFLDGCATAATQARALSRRLVLITRPELGARQTGPLEPLVRRVVAEGLAACPVVADFTFPAAPLLADHDEPALAEALAALVANAQEAMAAGGTLRVSGQRQDLGPDDPRGLAPGAYAHLAFRDTGPGLAPEALARAFEPYFTTKPRTSARGTGLGLAVCEAVVRAHRGRAWAESRPGAGAEFHLLLPLAAEAGPGSAGAV